MEITILFPILVFFIFNLIKCSNIVSFKLNYININNVEYNISSIFTDLRKTYLFSYIKIGEPEYEIEVNFSLVIPYFSMLSKLELIDEEQLLNYYNINKSKTFENITCLNQLYVQSTKDIAAKEKFKINIYNSENKICKEIEINHLDFVFGVPNIVKKNDNFTEIYFITIGLQYLTSSKNTEEKQYNFISLLKERDIINNYNWFIFYEKINLNENELYNLYDLINNKQMLLIGGSPHEFEPKKFHKQQLFSVYSNYFLWILEFKSVFFYRNNTKFNTGKIKQEIYHNKARININDFFIYAPSLYFSLINNEFFNDYISKNICHYYTDALINSFYYDKSENFSINNLTNFPPLFFEHNEFNYTFEFNYKDLFAEKDGKYIFLIAVKKRDIDDWYLGNIFLRKYQLVFNQDSKLISFYNKDIIVIDDEDNEDNEEKEIIIYKSNDDLKYIILFICLSLIVFIGIGFIIGYLIYRNNKNKKKKRANELVDDYEYMADNNIN